MPAFEVGRKVALPFKGVDGLQNSHRAGNHPQTGFLVLKTQPKKGNHNPKKIVHSLVKLIEVSPFGPPGRGAVGSQNFHAKLSLTPQEGTHKESVQKLPFKVRLKKNN